MDIVETYIEIENKIEELHGRLNKILNHKDSDFVKDVTKQLDVLKMSVNELNWTLMYYEKSYYEPK